MGGLELELLQTLSLIADVVEAAEKARSEGISGVPLLDAPLDALRNALESDFWRPTGDCPEC